MSIYLKTELHEKNVSLQVDVQVDFLKKKRYFFDLRKMVAGTPAGRIQVDAGSKNKPLRVPLRAEIKSISGSGLI